MSRYLEPGEPIAPPPTPDTMAWLGPDPTSIDMYVGEWYVFRNRSNIVLYLNDHVGVHAFSADGSDGHFTSHGATEPSIPAEEACRTAPADDVVSWRRAIHQQLWIAPCRAGDAIMTVRHETETVAPLSRYEFSTLAQGENREPGGGGAPRTSSPGAPRNLMAVGGDGQVVLTWDAPASDGGSATTDYEYRIDRRNPWTSIGSTNTTYTLTGLVNGTEYVFEVRAVNRIGKSFSSRRAEATPEAPEVFTLDFAHFANGTSITSDLVFVNLSTHPARPAIYFYDTEGALVSAESVVEGTGDLEIAEDGSLTVQTELEPLGVLTISTHGRGELVSGSVKAVSEGRPIGGGVRYNLPDIGVAGVGAQPTRQRRPLPRCDGRREESARRRRCTTWKRKR